MLTEILAICPCDQVFSIVFWNELNLCQPINKDCKRPIPKELYEKNNNIATEQLWDRKLIYILKHYLIFLFPNYPKMILILQTNHIL